MEYKDYYKTLGVPKNATEKEIRGAYRKLARKHHPDVNPGNPQAEARFKELNEAYQVLIDPEKRSKYDRFGSDWDRYQQTSSGRQEPDFARWFTGRAGDGETVYTTDENVGFSDFFRTLFGSSGRRTSTATSTRVRLQRGADLEQEVEISVEEAFHGTTRTLQLDVETTCPECGGRGMRQSQLCDTCRGRGTITDNRRLEVRIPAGVYDGARVRMAGQGEPGISGGPNGDLYLRIKLRPDARYRIEGADIRMELPVDLYTCVLGGEVDVTTPSGRKLALTVPAGTSNGRSFRLRGQGMPVLQNPSKRGDLYAAVSVQLPEHVSDEERRLFEQLRELSQRRSGARK
ncbi:MAG: J domain-containing protein [Chloroflexota bacterium]|nr:J domain-containing protein [Chloroflexota bacterium]